MLLRTIAVALLAVVSASADPIVAIAAGRTSTSARDGFKLIRLGPGDADAKVITTFNFHEPDTESEDFKKKLSQPGAPVAKKTTVHAYQAENEKHKTGGHVTYTIATATNRKPDPDLEGTDAFFIGAYAEGTIEPGKSASGTVLESGKVSIDGRIKDPLIFSDLAPNASLLLNREIDTTFSLEATTRFPSLFSPGKNLPGAIADETAISFRQRVVSGNVPDPDDFWADGLLGAIDLYLLTISSAADFTISAELTFGVSNGDFTLDYRDGLGNAFDPSDPSAIGALIAGAFVNGALGRELSNLFTVGLVANTSVSEFTYGGETTVLLAAVEQPVPEPATFGLLFVPLAAVYLASWRRRLTSAQLTTFHHAPR